MAQALTILGCERGILEKVVNSRRPEEYEHHYAEESFTRLEKALADLDKVRDEIINSENLEEELHDLIESVYAWAGSKVEPATLISQAQKAQRVLRKIVHVGETSKG